jgi:hypothetical protein
MRRENLAAGERAGRTQGDGAGRGDWPAGECRVGNRIRVDTPPREPGGRGIHAESSRQRPKEKQSERAGSVASTRDVRWNAAFRQNVMGRSCGAVAGSVDVGGVVSGKDGAFRVVYEQASQHGRGVFGEPLVEQGENLLAEIGGVAETREFVTLQGVARSAEKEFPGWLGVLRGRSGHRRLQIYLLSRNGYYSKSGKQRITSSFRVTGLWISVHAVENGLGACSGCSGDYEDPGLTAWEDEAEEEEEEREEER